MRVILCENVPNLGEIGTTVKVADGYALNYLFPRKLAVRADSGSARQIEHELRVIRRREEKMRAAMAQEAKKLNNATIEITARAGEEDRLFGTVTTAQIAEALRPLGYAVDRRSITLEEPIKTLGAHTAKVRLARGIEATVSILVVKEADEEPAPAESEPELVAEPVEEMDAESASEE